MDYVRAITAVLGSALLCAAQPLTHSELGWPRNYTPSLEPASMATWLKADFGVYADFGSTLATSGQSVRQWNDASGNGVNVATPVLATNQMYLTNQLNGLPILRFSASGGLTTNFTSSSEAAYIVLIRYHHTNGSVTLQTTFCEAGQYFVTNSAYIYAIPSSGGAQLYFTGNSLMPTNRFHIIVWVLNGPSSFIRVDGITVATMSLSNVSTTAFRIGGGSGSAGYGDIAEAIRYKANIPLQSIQFTELYLSNKWGL